MPRENKFIFEVKDLTKEQVEALSSCRKGNLSPESAELFDNVNAKYRAGKKYFSLHIKNVDEKRIQNLVMFIRHRMGKNKIDLSVFKIGNDQLVFQPGRPKPRAEVK